MGHRNWWLYQNYEELAADKGIGLIRLNWLQIVKEFSGFSTFVDYFLFVDFTKSVYIMIILEISTLSEHCTQPLSCSPLMFQAGFAIRTWLNQFQTSMPNTEL